MNLPGHFRFGVFEFDPTSCELRRSGHYVRLQQQPLQLLHLLLEKAGGLVSRDELRLGLWPVELVVDFDRNLNKAMHKLRHALGDTADSPRYIQTVHRVGYRFIAPVQKLNDPPAEVVEPVEATRTRELVTTPAAEVAKPTAWWSPRTLHPSGAAGRLMPVSPAILLIFLSVVFLATRSHVHALAMQVPAKPEKQSVAILVFRTLSTRPNDAWLATALANRLAMDLASRGQLRTIPWEKVQSTKKDLHVAETDRLNPDALKQVGRLLATDYVVVGAYGLVGKWPNRKIRLELKLQDVHSGEQVAEFSETGVETDLPGLVAGASKDLRGRFHQARAPLS